MFEPNEEAEVIVVKDIKGRSAVIVDDFYKNPDEARELALSLEYKDVPDAVAGFPGIRGFLETPEVKEKLYDTFLTLCSNVNIWNNPNNHFTGFPVDGFSENWDRQGFNINNMNDASLLNNPLAIIPHQDRWHDPAADYESSSLYFGAIIYLNTPDECAGGTNLFSYNGFMSIPPSIQPVWQQRLMLQWDLRPPDVDGSSDIDPEEVGVSGKGWLDNRSKVEKVKYLKEKLGGNDPYTVEFAFEMKYNRMVLYQADVLHSQNADLGMFTDYNRINQIFFM
jgi:hypothetical protein